MSTETTSARRARRAAARDQRENPSRPSAYKARRRRPRWLNLPILSLAAVLAGAAIIAIAVGGNAPAPVLNDIIIARLPVTAVTAGNVLGRADAPVTLDLYEDFQCPACGEWAETVFDRLLTNEIADGTAKLVFHDFSFLGAESTLAARAAYAAQQQDRLWDMWATIYANQGLEDAGNYSRERLVAMAAGLDLDVPRFEADLDGDASLAAVNASNAATKVAKVTSTPTLVIDGTLHTGLKPYPEIAAAILAATKP